MPVIINGSTGISGTDGSAGTPAVQGSDTNTGMFFPAADTIAFAEGGVESLRLDSSGNVSATGTVAMGSSFLRNRIINGAMFVSQRATSATVTAGTGVPTASTGYPCVDRFFVYSTGANVTAAQVTATGASPFLLRITGAASVTAVGVGQRIETNNSIDLAGQTCTLSVELANSLLTTVTWTASYANTTDTFGTIGTPTKTQIATGTFTVTSTLTRYSVNIAVPSAATTGIEILFTVGAQTSGTWDIDNVQLEVGTAATPFERRQFGQELTLCQRYFQIVNTRMAGTTGTGTNNGYRGRLSVTMRTTAAVSVVSSTNINTTGATVMSTNTETFEHSSSGSSSGGYISEATGWFSSEI
jgi:hypothetical protein